MTLDKSDPIIRASSALPIDGTALTVQCEGRNGGVLWIENNGRFLTNQPPYYIAKVTKNDTGDYICKERSSLGTKASSVYINVLCKCILICVSFRARAKSGTGPSTRGNALYCLQNSYIF